MPPNTRTLKGQSYSTKRWANLAWPKGSKLSGFSNTIDFIRFYIQDAKKRKKTAVQQLEQQPLFSFNRPEEVAALSSCDFTVALPKFTIPDKKVLIIEIQERNGGRHFYYKLKNTQLINAEILFPEIVGKP